MDLSLLFLNKNVSVWVDFENVSFFKWHIKMNYSSANKDNVRHAPYVVQDNIPTSDEWWYKHEIWARIEILQTNRTHTQPDMHSNRLIMRRFHCTFVKCKKGNSIKMVSMGLSQLNRIGWMVKVMLNFCRSQAFDKFAGRQQWDRWYDRPAGFHAYWPNASHAIVLRRCSPRRPRWNWPTKGSLL